MQSQQTLKCQTIPTLSALIRDALLAALGRSHLNSSIRPNRLDCGFWAGLLESREELSGDDAES